MQKNLLAVVFLIAFQSARPQAPATGAPVLLREGKVIYERKINIHRRMTDESMKAMVPEFNTSKTELIFSADESIWRNIKEDEDIRDQAGQDNNRVIMRFGGGDDQTYKNYATDKMTQQRELGPKKYIIEDSLQHQSWKLESDTRTVKGYSCKKAVTKNKEGRDVVAWYTEDIQSPSGPEQYGGLPGLILELNVNDAEIVFAAQEIVTKDFDKKWVAAPANGKKISRKDFQKMMEEQFGAQPGGGPTIRIIRN